MEYTKLVDLDKNLIETLTRNHDISKNKQKYPMINNQEIGWFIEFKDVESIKKFGKLDSRDTKFDEA